ncbi:acyl-CoA reductase [Parapedobacter lycopersici]|uniref:acyl-CoA reductase n=1 Tax=Parapedobacter lycopersici TaxID=1864939 RepID=UPI0033424109
MTKKQRIEAFTRLGAYLLSTDPHLQEVLETAASRNPWFTLPNVQHAVKAIAANLSEAQLGDWLAPYPFDGDTNQTVGLILAGNIPLVGFHDILSALCAGYRIQVKLAAADQQLTTHLLEQLQAIEPRFRDRIQLTERLKDFDAVIATGSDNSARYFEYYFGKVPHIIRKNRNSAAVLTGNETADELQRLGHDIFDFFGLGCRNVSKLFLPKGYDIALFFEGIAVFSGVIDHHKYRNNYDYNKSIYLINGDPHYDNGFLLVKRDARTASPLAVLYEEEYETTAELHTRLSALAPQLQCIVTGGTLPVPTPVFDFGRSQQPELNDYADGVNTLDFLAAHRGYPGGEHSAKR